MEVVSASDANQDDVSDAEGVRIARLEGDQVAVIDLAAHRVTARANLHCLAAPEAFLREVSPAHSIVLQIM